MRTLLLALCSLAASVACAQMTYTWTDITPPGGRVYEVGQHPLDARIIVRGQWTVGGTTVAVMYSSDKGATWSPPETALPATVISMFVSVGSPGVVYLEQAGFFARPGPAAPGYFPSPAQNGALYRSADFGRTWSVAHTSAVGEWIHLFASDPLDAHGLIAMARREASCLFAGCTYAGDVGMTQSHDDAATWSPPSPPPIQPGYGNLVGDVIGPTPADPMRLFLRTPDLRILVSRDRGATWSSFDPGLESKLESVVPDPVRANVLYAQRYYFDYIGHYVTLRSDDGGGSWREVFRSLSGRPPVVDPARTRTVWLGPEPNGPTTFVMHRTEDAGETWQDVPFPDGLFFYQSLFPSVAEPGTIYMLNNYRLYRGVPSKRPDPVVVEYHYDLDRYWLTSLDGEAVSQDYRKEPLNVWRTGLRWGAWRADDAPAGAVGSCRFWSSPRSGLRTRVLVQQGFECEALKRSPDWILEAENEFFTIPPAAGACGNGLVPVRRFNNLQPDANHRWVADDAIAAEMRGPRAWYDEGVRFCARPLGPNE